MPDANCARHLQRSADFVSLRETTGANVELPLLTRVLEGGDAFHLTPSTTSEAHTHENPVMGSLCGAGSQNPLPHLPGPGEQYRFHFDMTKCIGCKCCVVACNEQNGNPADILWRRVGEIEGGVYPKTHRHYISMGCNHCLEPTCLTGCPVDAYSKDSLTGIVRHSADACIGCQYCTWNCSYGVPQYNPERGVVGKCDMCYGRLARGQEPACAAACPESAIRIELVNVGEWRNDYRASANSPGMPSADDSISTTRVSLPVKMPADVGKVDLRHLRAAEAHWPLIVMTILTQLSVGAFASIWFLQVFGDQPHRAAALVALVVALVALGASTLHLGRPLHAIRALKMWRRSWLSREVLLFTLFALAGATYSGTLWINSRSTTCLGALTAVLGICGVGASARLYLVKGRPAWNTPLTFAEFGSTTIVLGFCGANVLVSARPQAAIVWSIAFALAIAGLKLVRLAKSRVHELHSSWQLLASVYSNHLLIRLVLMLAGMGVAAFGSGGWPRIVVGLLIVAEEFMGRYLFFVSVVPTNMASEYLVQEAA